MDFGGSGIIRWNFLEIGEAWIGTSFTSEPDRVTAPERQAGGAILEA